MALNKDTISINLAKGVDQKTDDKIATPDQMSTVIDSRYTKDKRLVKRENLLAQSTTVQTNFPNPLSIGSSSSKSKTFAHEDQLLLNNNGALYSQYKGQNQWIFKGHCLPVEVTAKTIASISFTDTVSVGSITALAGSGFVYVSEDSTGNVLAINSVSNVLRVVGFSNSIWVVTNSSSATKAQKVNSNGSLGSAITLGSGSFSATLDPARVSVTVTSSASAVGEMAFLFNGTKVLPFDSNGSVSSLGVLTTTGSGGGSGFYSIYCEPSLNPNKLYLAKSGGAANVASLGVWTFTSNAYTTVSGFTQIMSGTQLFGSASAFISLSRITQSISPINNTDLYVFADTTWLTVTSGDFQSAVGSETHSFDSTVFYTVSNLTGSTTTQASVYGRGYQLAANSIRDSSRGTIYLPCVLWSPLQSTNFLFDVLKGKPTYTTYAASKWFYGMATQAQSLSQSLAVSSGSGLYRFTNNGNLIGLNFYPPYAQNSQYYAKTTHLTGGLLWAYDGQSIAEHNFLYAPEITAMWAGQDSYIVLAITQQGDASTKEIFTLTVSPGGFWQDGTGGVTGTFRYIQYNTVSVGNYYIWFRVDGVGGDPAPGGRTGIAVSILSTDTANEVAFKTAQAVGTGNGFQVTVAANVVTFTSSGNGAVTDATREGSAPLAGNLGAGSYQYCAVWKWVDRNGNIYRSASSVPLTFTASSGDRASFLVWCPAITNKNVADVHVELYRTLVNASSFQLVSSSKVWSLTGSRISYQDGASDASISANQIIYTDGGVLDNYNIGACSAVSAFKERLVINTIDDPFSVFYSKTNVSGEPINFAAELFFRIDSDSSKVEANAQLDDKLISFKGGLLYVQSGDGANDLGQGSTFSQPFLIAADVGTRNPNSIALYPSGILFKSDKGIYHLDRSLATAYVGAPVEDYNSNALSSAVLLPNTSEIVFTLQDSDTALIYNYYFNRWDFFSNHMADSACLWQKKLALTRANGQVSIQGTGYLDFNGTSSTSYSMGVGTQWLRLKGVQDYQRVYELTFLGEWLAPHIATVQVFYDYDDSTGDTFTFDATSTLTPYQFRVFPTKQKCESIKVVFSETSGSSSGQALILNDLTALVGLKKGPFIIPPNRTAT